MGYIIEPKGIDLIVSPMSLSSEDREAISAIIKTFKLTGEIPHIQKNMGLKKKKTTKPQKLVFPKARKIALARR